MKKNDDFPEATSADMDVAAAETPDATAAGAADGARAPFVLTPENYYSDDANRLYLSNSLFKDVYGYPADPYPCEARALLGEKETSEALLVGGYVDAAFESDQAFKDFKERNESKIRLKSGKGYYKFITDADLAIARARRDKVFMSYLEGQHQAVMAGEIGGQPFKIKMDAYAPHVRITDLKYVKDAGESYNEFLKRRVTFIEDYGYAIQGAIYQEIVYQNTGERLPFYIAYITKETIPDFGVVQIGQEMLDDALEFVRMSLAARPMDRIRLHPKSCGRRSCPFCRDQLVLKGAYSFEEFAQRAAG